MDALSVADTELLIEHFRRLDEAMLRHLANNRALLSITVTSILLRRSPASASASAREATTTDPSDPTTPTTEQHRSVLQAVLHAIGIPMSAADAAATALPASFAANGSQTTGSTASTTSTASTPIDSTVATPGSTASSSPGVATSTASTGVASVDADVAESNEADVAEPNELVNALSDNNATSSSSDGSPASASASTHRRPSNNEHPDLTVFSTRHQHVQPAIMLLGTTLSSKDYCCPVKFRVVGGTDAQPEPLHIVAKIKRNHFNNKIGTTDYRIVMLDVGDGKDTRLEVENGSDFYNLDRNHNPVPPGTIVALHNVSGKKGFGRKALIYSINSSIHKFRRPINWVDVLRWYHAMNEQYRSQAA